MTDISLIKQLREESGISIGECKDALERSGGDIEKARQVLRDRGAEIAAKKQDREAPEGAVFCYIHSNAKLGAMVELRSETDFVAKGDDLTHLGQEVAMQVASMNPGNVEELLDQAYIKDPGRTVRDIINDAIAKVGENIAVARFSRFEV